MLLKHVVGITVDNEAFQVSETLKKLSRIVGYIIRFQETFTCLNSNYLIYYLGYLRQISYSLWTSIFLSIKSGSKYLSQVVGMSIKNEIVYVKWPGTEEVKIKVTALPPSLQRH